MKKSLLMMAMMLVALAASAKDIKTVVFTTTPQMHCASCENKIKGNLKFEKGVKQIETNVEQQKVTVQYDADKTSADNIMAAFSKFGYTAKRVDTAAEGCCNVVEPDCAKMKECGKKADCGKALVGARGVKKAEGLQAMSARKGVCGKKKASCGSEKTSCGSENGQCAAAGKTNDCCNKEQKAGCCKE